MFAYSFAWVLLAMGTVRINSVKIGHAVFADCELPPNSVWTQVSVPGISPFSMAVYSQNDIVSNALISGHAWEHMSLSSYGFPGHAFDIGGNIGFYTFVLAKAGWNVTTFEPLPSNLALIRATLCANPDVGNRIDLHPIALGGATGRCQIVSGTENVGDGLIVCGKNVPQGYEVRGEFEVKKLDDVAPAVRFAKQHVDFVKIDVEGFECRVFEGASTLLAQKPRLIQTEVWENMQGCTPQEYFQRFRSLRYQVKSDVNCQTDASLAGPKGIADYWICSPDHYTVVKSKTEVAFAGLVRAASLMHTGERWASSKARHTMILELLAPEK